MITIKIISIDKKEIVATGEPYLDVAVQLTDTDIKKPILRKLGFAIDTPKATIKAEVKKMAETYRLEKAQSAQDIKVVAQDAHVTDLKDLEGEEVATLEDSASEPKNVKKNVRDKNSTKARK